MWLKSSKEIREQLGQRDVVLAKLVERYGEIEIALAQNYFETLCSSIVGQQLSNKVADIIWKRLVNLLGGQAGATPNAIKTPSNYVQSTQFQLVPEAIVVAKQEDLRSNAWFRENAPKYGLIFEEGKK